MDLDLHYSDADPQPAWKNYAKFLVARGTKINAPFFDPKLQKHFRIILKGLAL